MKVEIVGPNCLTPVKFILECGARLLQNHLIDSTEIYEVCIMHND